MAMNPIVKNTLAVIAGIVAGSLVNISLVNIGPSIVPLPQGADVSTAESLAESMKLFTPINFLFPFLAHALGTLVGAFVAAKFAASHQVKFAMLIGVLFLAGGISAVIMFGGPLWFKITDLGFAYIPMGYLGAVLAGRPRSSAAK